ncbi:hypothetical protein [Bacillus phage phiAGATE]|uniref:Uncharacterized protein n=1 Tax=Bacillus phage phiAGATE TaxID=1204533 RepID=L0L935_9CAUD|nr:hypothetical protein G380_gp190 [Bacillus phage phiAGATE]AGB62633.1 hypothetical protein [Bacillus phage phiAGATE]
MKNSTMSGLVKIVLREVNDAILEELKKKLEGKVDDSDKVANSLENMFKDKEEINEFIKDTLEDAQELASQREADIKYREKLVSYLDVLTQQEPPEFTEEEEKVFKENLESSSQEETDNPCSLVSAVERFFDLVNSEEDAHKFAEELQLFLPTHKRGNFGFGTSTGISYGRYSLCDKDLTLKSDGERVIVQYTLTEDDVTNPELAKELFHSNHEQGADSTEVCGCVNKCGGDEDDEDNDDEDNDDFPGVYDIIEDIEETEEEFYNSVEVILQNIIRHYSNNMPNYATMSEYDEAAMRFFLTHCSTLHSPAAITALSKGDLLHEFKRRIQAVSNSK